MCQFAICKQCASLSSRRLISKSLWHRLELKTWLYKGVSLKWRRKIKKKTKTLNKYSNKKRQNTNIFFKLSQLHGEKWRGRQFCLSCEIRKDFRMFICFLSCQEIKVHWAGEEQSHHWLSHGLKGRTPVCVMDYTSTVVKTWPLSLAMG